VKFRLLATLACVAILSACAFQNKYESEADKITKAVIANDITPVKADLSPALLSTITRVQIAAAGDELGAQGALKSVKEVTPCPKGAQFHCFDVTFEKRVYDEWLSMDDTGKVTAWRYHMKP
jgi:hypothetical protein